MGEKNGFFGKHHSEESKLLLRKSHLDKGVLTEEQVVQRIKAKQTHISCIYDLRKFGYENSGYHRNRITWERKNSCNFISFGLKVPFDWHHINETDVVAVPRYIHSSCPHSLKAGTQTKIEGILG